jgi:hypothetical protein
MRKFSLSIFLPLIAFSILTYSSTHALQLGYQFKAGQFRNWGLGIGDWEAVA